MRFILLLLLLVNGVFFAWSQGYLKDYGFAPAVVGEPQRMGQQIRPEAIRLLRPDEVRRLDAAAASRPLECLQAGPLDEAQAQAARAALQTTLPANAWELMMTEEPARWIVYMGKYANAQALVAKRAELAAKNLKYEPVGNPALEPGLSLGGFASQQEADAALVAMSQRGVRTAKVVQEKAETRAWLLRLAAVDESMKPQIDELRSLLGGKPLRNCR
jgi:hypothetical protein